MSRVGIQSWVPLLVLAIALVLLFAPLLMGSRVLFWGLPSLQFYPWRAFAFEELSVGRIPFWNPYNGGGAPLLANYQTAVFYPPNWLYVILDYRYAMNLLAVLHLFLGGLGMWMFTKALGVTPLGRGISTLTFALAGYSIARMGSFPTADAVAWIPWLFWAVISVLERRKFLYVGFLGIITALLLYTGHAQTAWYALLSAGAFALWFFWRMGDVPRPRRLTWLLLIGGAVVLGAGIASTQLLFTAELLRESQRSGGVDYDTLTNLSFAPLRLINFVMPSFFGTPVDGSYLTPGKGVYFEDAVYIGFLPLISAVAAIVGWFQWRNLLLEPRRAFRTVPFWVLMSIVGTILAFGKFTPLYRIFYDYVPTFSAFREPVRWMILPVFALSVLAGIGVQNWGRGQRLFYWSRLFGAGGAGIAILSIVIRLLSDSDEAFIPVLTAAFAAMGAWLAGSCILTLLQPDEISDISPAPWQLAVLIFVAADLIWAGQGLNPTAPNEYYREVSLTEPQGRLYWYEDYEEEVKFEHYFDLSDYRTATRNCQVRRSLLPNINMLDNVALFNNFDPLKSRYHTRYVELIEENPEHENLLLAAGIGQVYGNAQPDGWRRIAGDTPSYRAPSTPPIAWVVPRAEWIAESAELEAKMLDALWSPQEKVFLSGEAPQNDENDPLLVEEEDLVYSAPPLTEIEFFEVMRDTPDHKTFRVVSDGSGYLVLANTYYPGWTVKVNDETRELHRANLSFMAVQLPAGDAEVSFRYLPTINLLSLMVSFIATAVALGLIVLGLVRQGVQ